jgi:hypothetical protein
VQRRQSSDALAWGLRATPRRGRGHHVKVGYTSQAMSEKVFRINEKVCVILGAGASADAWNVGGPLRDNDWAPPLAKELFQLGARKVFGKVAQSYPGVRVLASQLAESVEAGTATLETKLLKPTFSI